MPRLFGDAYHFVSDPFLRRACELAERGRGTTSPNPLVGCVIVRDGRVVGEGFHERAGGPHAEVGALAAAGEHARGAVAYVTLEPCAHQGRTPPCAPALVKAGVARVVIGMRDPTAIAAGGAAVLENGGVAVEFASDPRPFEELNVEWLHRQRTERPFTRVKVALTLDGHPALVSGRRAELTGEQARVLTMRLRGWADAVIVGTGTVVADDPALTVRDSDGAPAPHQPRRIVLARTEQPPASSRLFHDGLGRVHVLLPEETELDAALVSAGASAITYPVADGLAGALEALAREDVVSLLVEAGPRLFSALLAADLVDELVLYHAGGVAGAESPPLYVGESQEEPETLTRRLRAVEAGVAGDDAVTVWRPIQPDDE
jgi:diaminohydroxyphosphoribosylaminopyrimidine deaminase / 5-amino-6-(5-phosphoribosylamino)uracil reductase